MEKMFEKSIFFSSVVFFQSQAGNAAVLEHRSPEPAASPLQKEPLQQIRYACAFDRGICYVHSALSGGDCFSRCIFPHSYPLHYAAFCVPSQSAVNLQRYQRNLQRAQANHWNLKHDISLYCTFLVKREGKPPAFMKGLRELLHMIIQATEKQVSLKSV